MDSVSSLNVDAIHKDTEMNVKALKNDLSGETASMEDEDSSSRTSDGEMQPSEPTTARAPLTVDIFQIAQQFSARKQQHKHQLLVLVSLYGHADREGAAQQSNTLTILQGALGNTMEEPFLLVDASDYTHWPLRDELLELSDVGAVYPQFFLVKKRKAASNSSNKLHDLYQDVRFFGDYNDLFAANEHGTLRSSFLAQKPLYKKDIEEEEEVEGHEVEPGHVKLAGDIGTEDTKSATEPTEVTNEPMQVTTEPAEESSPEEAEPTVEPSVDLPAVSDNDTVVSEEQATVPTEEEEVVPSVSDDDDVAGEEQAAEESSKSSTDWVVVEDMVVAEKEEEAVVQDEKAAPEENLAEEEEAAPEETVAEEEEAAPETFGAPEEAVATRPDEDEARIDEPAPGELESEKVPVPDDEEAASEEVGASEETVASRPGFFWGGEAAPGELESEEVPVHEDEEAAQEEVVASRPGFFWGGEPAPGELESEEVQEDDPVMKSEKELDDEIVEEPSQGGAEEPTNAKEEEEASELEDPIPSQPEAPEPAPAAVEEEREEKHEEPTEGEPQQEATETTPPTLEEHPEEKHQNPEPTSSSNKTTEEFQKKRKENCICDVPDWVDTWMFLPTNPVVRMVESITRKITEDKRVETKIEVTLLALDGEQRIQSRTMITDFDSKAAWCLG